MSHLELVLIAGLAAAAAGCTATINGYPYAENDKGNVRMDLDTDDDEQDAGASAAAGSEARDPEPPAKPAIMDAGSMDAGTKPPPAPMQMAGSAPPPVTAACDFKGLIQAKCGNAGCHGGPSAGSGLDLTSASLAMRVATRKGAGACSSKLLVDKENPEQSVLYRKVSGIDCGSQMPLGGSLTADEQECVLSWIDGL